MTLNAMPKNPNPVVMVIILTVLLVGGIFMVVYFTSFSPMSYDFSEHEEIDPSGAAALKSYRGKPVAVRGVARPADKGKMLKLFNTSNILAYNRAQVKYMGSKRRTRVYPGKHVPYYIDTGNAKVLIKGQPGRIYDFSSNIDGTKKGEYFLTLREGRKYSVFGVVESGKTPYVKPFLITSEPVGKIRERSSKNRRLLQYVRYITIAVFALLYIYGLFQIGVFIPKVKDEDYFNGINRKNKNR